MSAHQRALDKCKIQLMTKPDMVFFTTVAFSLKHIWDETVPTAETDGICIWYNPDFFMSLTPDEQLFLLLHETLHVVFQHMVRKGDLDAKKWNYAADYVINYILVQRKFKMPAGGLYDAQYADLTTDQIYKLLPDQPKIDLPMSDLRSPKKPQDIQEISQKIDQILVRASLQSQMAGEKPGTIPGAIQFYIDSLVNPKLPWHNILARYVNKVIRQGFNWQKPNRRFFPKHYLPSRASKKLCDIAVAIDTSCSVTDAEFQRFASEVYAILKHQRPSSLTLIQFDTRIHNVTKLTSARDLMKTQFTGRGGTRIKEVVEWGAKHKPHILLVFSDGGFHNTHSALKTPVIWVINDNPGYRAPWGKTIHYEAA